MMISTWDNKPDYDSNSLLCQNCWSSVHQHKTALFSQSVSKKCAQRLSNWQRTQQQHVHCLVQICLNFFPVFQCTSLCETIRSSIVYPCNVLIRHFAFQLSFSGIAVHVSLYHSFWVLHTPWPHHILVALPTFTEGRVMFYGIIVIGSTDLVGSSWPAMISNCIQWLTFSSSFHLSDGIEELTTDSDWREKEQNWWTVHVFVCSTLACKAYLQQILTQGVYTRATSHWSSSWENCQD